MRKQLSLGTALLVGWFRLTSIGMTVWVLIFTAPTFIAEKIGFDIKISYTDPVFFDRYIWAMFLMYFGMGIVGLIGGFVKYVSHRNSRGNT